MSKAKTKNFWYSGSAIQRIQKLGMRKITDFLNEIDPEMLKKAATILPRPHGFRPNSQSGIHQKIHHFSSRFVEHRYKNGDARYDLNFLGLVWVYWGCEKLGDIKEVSAFIDGYEPEVGTSGTELGEAPVDTQVRKLFQKLKDLSYQDQFARSAIRRFHLFSPFPSNDELEALIEASKPAALVIHCSPSGLMGPKKAIA